MAQRHVPSSPSPGCRLVRWRAARRLVILTVARQPTRIRLVTGSIRSGSPSCGPTVRTSAHQQISGQAALPGKGSVKRQPTLSEVTGHSGRGMHDQMRNEATGCPVSDNIVPLSLVCNSRRSVSIHAHPMHQQEQAQQM